MATVTGTLTVNAAFLREIKEDNLRLRELLEEVERLVQSSEDDTSCFRRLAEALSELRDQLALHFSLEEAYGYFEDAVEVAPNLSERASELRSQHSTLFLDACRLAEMAEQRLYGEKGGDILQKIALSYAQFQQALRQHESREGDLIMEAFESDTGVGD